MNLLWQMAQVLLWIYLASVMAGALGYVVRRMTRSQPAPAHGVPVAPAPLAGVLGEARQDVLIIALITTIAGLLLGGGSLDLLWEVAAATAIWGLTSCVPPHVTWGRARRGTLLLVAAILAVVLGSQIPRATVIDRLLVVFLALGLLVLWMRVRCRAVTPIAPPPLPAGATELAQQQQALPHMRPSQATPATEHIQLTRTPAELMAAVGRRVVGQDQALGAWQSLLERESAFFSPNSTKPLSVLHVGPASSGKEAMSLALARELGVTVEIVPGDQLGPWASRVAQRLRPRPACLVVTQPDRIPEALRGEITDLVLGRMPFWNRTMIIVLSEALTPDPVLEQGPLRELLVGAGLDRGLALGVRAVIPFVPLEAWALAGVAAKVLSDEAQHHGMELRWLDPEALDEVVSAIPAAAREQGAAGVAYGIANTIGRKLDEAKGNGWRTIRVEKTPAGVAVLQET